MSINEKEYQKIWALVGKLIEKNKEKANPFEMMTILISSAIEIALHNAPTKEEGIKVLLEYTNFIIEREKGE